MTADVDVEVEDQTTTFTVRGEIDLANHEKVGDQLTDGITNQATVVRIDLTDVAFIDSAGLRMLFGLATRLERLQTELQLVAPEHSAARRVIDLSGLSALAIVREDLS